MRSVLHSLRIIAMSAIFAIATGCGGDSEDAGGASARLGDYAPRAADVAGDLDAVKAIQDEWLTSIRALRDRGAIAPGMSLATLESHLGPPTNRGDDWVEWYFESGNMVNPSVIASLQGEVVAGVAISAR